MPESVNLVLEVLDVNCPGTVTSWRICFSRKTGLKASVLSRASCSFVASKYRHCITSSAILSAIARSQPSPSMPPVRRPLPTPPCNVPRVVDDIMRERHDIRSFVRIHKWGTREVRGPNHGSITVPIPVPDNHIVHCVVPICEHHHEKLEDMPISS